MSKRGAKARAEYAYPAHPLLRHPCPACFWRTRRCALQAHSPFVVRTEQAMVDHMMLRPPYQFSYEAAIFSPFPYAMKARQFIALRPMHCRQ
eukprot:6210017-Pleurochrysis_carterae.AAC.1